MELGLANLEECLDQLIDHAMQDEPRKLTFKVDERTCVFRRLTDSQYRDAGRTAIAFSDPHPISIYKIREREFNLAQTYAACCSLFGVFQLWHSCNQNAIATETAVSRQTFETVLSIRCVGVGERFQRDGWDFIAQSLPRRNGLR